MMLEFGQWWTVEGDSRVEVWKLETFERAYVKPH